MFQFVLAKTIRIRFEEPTICTIFFESLKRVDLIKAISAAGVVGWQQNFHGSFSAPAFQELDKWKGKAEAKLLKPCGTESKFVGHEISLPGPIGVDG